MKHTPGPWELGYSDLGSQIISSADGYVAVVHYWSRPEQEMKANARLIAVAPELLEALEALELAANTVNGCYTRNPGNFAVALREMIEKAAEARAAIAKAKGDS
jgi:hypothetical protein